METGTDYSVAVIHTKLPCVAAFVSEEEAFSLLASSQLTASVRSGWMLC